MPTDPSYTPAADIARDREHLISRFIISRFIATRRQSEQIAGRLVGGKRRKLGRAALLARKRQWRMG